VKTVPIRKAKLSALIAAAEQGQPILLSHHGQACAKIVPEADGGRLYPMEKPNLADYLLAMPEPLEAERNGTPLRDIDFA
jgi:antitoxin (DNA-binding transcriptional repressor) of toxin-antitoxin stability system